VSFEVYLILTEILAERGWSARKWEDWMAATTAAALLR